MFLLLACVAPPSDSVVDAHETGKHDSPPADSSPTDSLPTDTGPAGYYGSVPTQDWPVPSFTATNQYGTARGPDDLTASRTVVWFRDTTSLDC